MDFFSIVHHHAVETLDKDVRHAIVVDQTARPLYTITVRTGDLAGRQAARFLRDICLDYGELQELLNKRMSYGDYIALLKSSRLL